MAAAHTAVARCGKTNYVFRRRIGPDEAFRNDYAPNG
jgi:hypothetical protein